MKQKDDSVVQLNSLEEAVSSIDDVFIKSNNERLYHFVIDKIGKALIERVLERAYGNQLRTARILGINRNTLREKIRRLHIDVARWKS